MATTAHRPGVVVLAGPPCSGKSTVGRLLAPASRGRGRVLVEVDAVFALLMPGAGRGREHRMQAYEAAHGIARALLDHDYLPVLESTYSRREQRAALIAGVGDAPLFVVEFAVTPDEAVRRFRRRTQDTDLDEALLRDRVASYPYGPSVFGVGAAAPSDAAAAIGRWLDGAPQPTPPEA